MWPNVTVAWLALLLNFQEALIANLSSKTVHLQPPIDSW
jgi:hypothetical protein